MNPSNNLSWFFYTRIISSKSIVTRRSTIIDGRLFAVENQFTVNTLLAASSSGGHRRVIVSDASFTILDEPTAALDPVSESNVYSQFRAISRGHTSLFISHRLGSTKLADKIFVLDSGRVTEEGSHEELMAVNGLYAEMYEVQRSWYTA